MSDATPDIAQLLARARELQVQDPQLAELAPRPEILQELQGCRHTVELLALACERYADRPAIGTCGAAVWSYAALWRRVVEVASGMHHQGLVRRGELVGICGYGSPDFVVMELACLYLGAVSAPLQTTLPAEELARIVQVAEMACLVASRDKLDLVSGILPACPTVRSLGVIDGHVEAPGIWTPDTLPAGAPVPMTVPAAGTDPLVTLVYTSGSTGLPKGAMYPDSLWREAWLRMARDGHFPLLPYLSVGYLPMNHLMGRAAVVGSLARGGLLLFSRSPDMSTLFDDIRLVRPTTLVLVPRVAELAYRHYLLELARGGEEEAVLARMRHTFLGDRLLWATIGSAPTSPEVMAFLRRCFQVPILEGYGSTEAGVITYEGRVATDEVLAYKLLDVPEAGYTRADRPHPRGQLLVKTRFAIPGYYKSPEATRALFDDEGYLRTGDIVEERAPGELVWLDRAKDVLKLSQGEFVTLWKVEGQLTAGSPAIRQAFLYGRGDRPYMVAVLVPDPAVVPQGNDEEARRVLRVELERVAGLRPYEVPRDFLVEWTPFSKENGLLTESGKIARPRLRQRYGTQLERLYDKIERNQLREAARLELVADAPVAERIRTAVQTVLGVEDVDLERRFTDLGGDSLAAVQLATLIEELCGVRLPEAQILGPGGTPAALARAVEAAGLAEGRPTADAIHGPGAQVIKAADLRLERFLTPAELNLLPYEGASFRQCLLTGASGFLGRFLVLELLARLPAHQGRLYCLVRARDDAEAERRLRGVFEDADPVLRSRFERLAAGRLVVLAGDLMAPRLGLAERKFEQLADELDVIVHNGALVNHAYRYQQLYEPNVLGTLEVIRLALRHHAKAVAYVSTIGVAAGQAVSEALDPRELWPERPANTGYAVGYATSKWAGEVLLREYQQRTGAPVAVFRPSMILTPEAYAGVINAPDLFVRLLAGLVYTGVAPGSFYAPSASPSFDGLPADFVARSIAALAFAMAPGWRTFHVTNPQGNAGISLDTVVDWVASAGYPLQRIADHGAWFAEFGRRLRALDETRRQHSPLPILYSWERPERVDRQGRLDNTAFRTRVREVLGLTSLPHLNEALVHKTLAAMVSRGLISPPGRPGPVTWLEGGTGQRSAPSGR